MAPSNPINLDDFIRALWQVSLHMPDSLWEELAQKRSKQRNTMTIYERAALHMFPHLAAENSRQDLQKKGETLYTKYRKKKEEIILGLQNLQAVADQAAHNNVDVNQEENLNNGDNHGVQNPQVVATPAAHTDVDNNQEENFNNGDNHDVQNPQEVATPAAQIDVDKNQEENFNIGVKSVDQVGTDSEEDDNFTPSGDFNNPAVSFTAVLPSQLWELIFDEEEMTLHPMWTDIFNDFILEPHQSQCTFKFSAYKFKKSNSRRKNAPAFTGSAQCKHSLCSTVKLIMQTLPEKGQDAIVVVHVFGDLIHMTGEAFRRNVRWYRREALKEALLVSKPNQVRLECLFNVDDSILEHGNMNNAFSLTLLQKISSETLCSQRLSPDPWRDLEKMMEQSNEEYGIDILCEKPFILYWRTGYHINLLPEAREKFVLYLDCTGQICTDLFGKKVLYYSGVIRPKGSTKPVPIFECISDAHNRAAISFSLEKFKVSCSHSGKTPFPPVVVVDDSWPLIYSCVQVFNGMDIVHYLHVCMNALNQMDCPPSLGCTKVHVCGAHVAHTVANWLGSRFKTKEATYLARRSFRALMTVSNLRDAQEIFRLMVTVFGSPTRSDQVESAERSLRTLLQTKLCPGQELLDIDEPTNIKEIPENIRKANIPLYSQSPFYKVFENITENLAVEEEDAEVEDAEIKNKMYLKGFINYLLKHQMPYYPLWSKLFVIPYVGVSGLLVNNCVEGWFHIVKCYILFKKLRLRPGDLLRILNEALKLRCKDVRVNTKIRRKTPSKNPVTPRKVSKADRQAARGVEPPTRLKRKRSALHPDHCVEKWDHKRSRQGAPLFTSTGKEISAVEPEVQPEGGSSADKAGDSIPGNLLENSR